MGIFETFLTQQFLIFVLVLARLGGLMTTAPIFGSQTAPVRIRGLLAVGMTLVVAPHFFGRPIAMPDSVLGMGILIAGEILVGLAYALCLLIIFSGVQVAGQIIGQLSGMMLADVFDPTFDAQSPIFSQLLYMLSLAVFLLIGGHRMAVGALLDTFQALPPGLATIGDSVPAALIHVLSESFTLGIRAVAPVMAALLLATLVMGLISRTLPQLNILAFGFGLNALILHSALFLSLGGIAWTLQGEFEPVIDHVHQAILEDAAPRPANAE
ncbi:MAG: flagellar biosynthetic protein FliR [Planctomycetales bacterium]|nr:flagellar biosynthetic protein FliR [Planctomycetales bacterium]